MIVSIIDGRIRIRNLRLKEGAFAGELKRHLLAVNGLREILINPRVGSALLVYDTSITSAERIIKRISRLLNISQKTEVQKGKVSGVNIIREFSLNKLNTRKAVRIGLIAALSASLIALVFGSKALHAAFGLVFLSFAAIHIFKYEKLLFA